MLRRLLLDNICGCGIPIFITTLSGPNGTSRFYWAKLRKNISFTFEVQIHTYSTKQQCSIKFLSVIICKTSFSPFKTECCEDTKKSIFLWCVILFFTSASRSKKRIHSTLTSVIPPPAFSICTSLSQFNFNLIWFHLNLM